MGKIISMTLSTASIDAAIAELRSYAVSLEAKAGMIAERLANEGYQFAFRMLADHVYSGETISSLAVIEKSPTSYEITAGSVALMFLEFGSGVNALPGYQGTFPGQTHAFDPGGWWFPTDDPNLAVYTNEEGQMFGHTYGMKPIRPMYETSKDIRASVERIAREVFSLD